MDEQVYFDVAPSSSPSPSPSPSPSSASRSIIRQCIEDSCKRLGCLVSDCCNIIRDQFIIINNNSLLLTDTNLPLPGSANYLLMEEHLLLLLVTIWRHALDNLHAVEKELYLSLTPDQLDLTSQQPYDDDFYGLGENFKVDPDHAIQHLDTEIVERIYFLERSRRSLLEFLSKLYMEVDGFAERIVSGREKSPALLLVNINRYFLDLEASIGTISTIGSLSFEELPFQNDDHVSEWSLYDSTDDVHLIYSNLNKLDKYLSLVVTKYDEPMKQGRRWMHYTLGAIGISVLSVWLLRHRRLSVIVDNWVLVAKESTSRFLSDHVVQPLTALGDGLFKTYRDRHKGVMEQEQQQLTSDLLRRMLLDFGERRGQKFPPNASEQEMLDMVTGSFEEQLRHPIKNLIMGDLGYSMLIDFLKLKLDMERVMPELNNQLVRIEESNLIMLATVTILLYLGVRKISRASAKSRSCLKQDIRTADINRIAESERRLLLEAKKYFMQQEEKNILSSQEHRHYINGLLLYTLDRLYRAVEKYGKRTGTWHWLRDDIITLGMPDVRTLLKLNVISEWEERENWLLPLAVP